MLKRLCDRCDINGIVRLLSFPDSSLDGEVKDIVETSYFVDAPPSEIEPRQRVARAMIRYVVSRDIDEDRDLQLAVFCKEYWVAANLIECGRKPSYVELYHAPNSKSCFKTAMQIAYANKDTKMVALLLSYDVGLCTRHPHSAPFVHEFNVSILKVECALHGPSSASGWFYTVAAIKHGNYEMAIIYVAKADKIDSDRLLVAMLYCTSINPDVTTFVPAYCGIRGMTQYDLPYLSDAILVTQQIDGIRREISEIRRRIDLLKANKTWDAIEDDDVLYPLLTNIFHSKL